jgi:7-keto-8-aminopelargonate synthetase-like enzyme
MMNTLHRFRHNETAISLGNQYWNQACDYNLIDIGIRNQGLGHVINREGYDFVNMVSLSYLGLDTHPCVVDGAIEALKNEKSMREAVARLRIHNGILDELEENLSLLFNARVTTALSCSVATAAALPLLASGHLTNNEAPHMLFDRFCHFSMNFIKPICADETTVETCPHNDLNFIEDACKKHKRVAYIADGVYSLGGYTPIKELMELQNKYGLFLFFDESHSLSVWGNYGEGFVRSSIKEINSNIAISASLSKGFGSTGGALMLGSKNHEDLIKRFGGPISWSQSMNVASIGAALGSAKVHSTPELKTLQNKLQANIHLFDQHIRTDQHGNNQQIRVIKIPKEILAVQISKDIFDQGFYASAVFFPIVPKHTAALRIIIRANHKPEDIVRFCHTVKHVTAKYDLEV